MVIQQLLRYDLSEWIRYIVLSIDSYYHILSFDNFMNEMEASENVLGFIMKPRFLSLSNDPSVITLNWHRPFYLRNHTQFCDEFFHPTASLIAMYSSSIIESATVCCLKHFQLTAPPFRINT